MDNDRNLVLDRTEPRARDRRQPLLLSRAVLPMGEIPPRDRFSEKV